MYSLSRPRTVEGIVVDIFCWQNVANAIRTNLCCLAFRLLTNYHRLYENHQSCSDAYFIEWPRSSIQLLFVMPKRSPGPEWAVLQGYSSVLTWSTLFKPLFSTRTYTLKPWWFRRAWAGNAGRRHNFISSQKERKQQVSCHDFETSKAYPTTRWSRRSRVEVK